MDHRGKTRPDLRESQANQYDPRTFLLFEEEQLTYRELEVQANQVAWVLRDRGVDKEHKVALLGRRDNSAMRGIAGGLQDPGERQLPR